jgi:hypothetical protein
MPSAPHSYWIFADWGTTFLWNLKCTDPDDDPPVGVEEIEDRYPRLADFYFEWVQIYDDAFTSQERHLGRKAPIFMRVDEFVAWKTEGFLLGCWLALQDDVQEMDVRYSRYLVYHLRKGQLEKGLARFLIDMEEFLLEHQGQEFFPD